MYLRFVEVKVRPESIPEVRKLYENKVIPALQGVEGCLYASLVRAEHHVDECVSMTLWRRREDAEVYERSGLFQQLMNEGKPFLSGASEWKIALSEDFTVAYEAVTEEPVISAYELPQLDAAVVLSDKSFASLYVRIVSPQLRAGQLDEFKRIYTAEILPALRHVKGCRYVYLMDNLKKTNEVISLSIWDRRQDAEAYEGSGLFQELVAKVEHTFAEVHQWKMQLARQTHSRSLTSEEMTVEGYTVVTGKSFI
jgi:quinol monooxygenase YgiN